MGGSTSKQQSESKENNQFSEDVWSPQGGALQDLYGQAASLYGGGNDFMGEINESAGKSNAWTDQIMGDQQSGMDDLLGGGSYGDTGDIRQKLMASMDGSPSNVGNMYNSIIGGEGNTYMDPMVDAMKQGAMENNQMLQSGTAMDAASMGQSGSSRHAMQNAMTNRATNQDMMNQESMMRGSGYDKDMQMKMGIAQQADQGQQMNQDRMLSMLQGADANKQAGMNMGQNMQNIGLGTMNPWQQAQQAQWNPMQNWASILGGPQTLSSGSGSGSSQSKGDSISGGMFGG